MGRRVLKVVEEKDFSERFVQRAAATLLLVGIGIAVGYFWAVTAYGVLG